MKQKNILPSITEPSTIATEPNVNVINKLSNLLRKYTQKRKKERESKNGDEKKTFKHRHKCINSNGRRRQKIFFLYSINKMKKLYINLIF